MARAYLNSVSFPARTLAESLVALGNLKTGIAHLIERKAIAFPVMCSVRVPQLALSPDYETLAQGMQVDGGRHRDTILFFLNVLDQQSPAQSALSEELQTEMNPHLVEETLTTPFDDDFASVLVASALDDGVLLSLGTSDRWSQDRVAYELMTNTGGLRAVEVDNVCDRATSEIVAGRADVAQRQYLFENWDALTGGATRAPQLDEWFVECRKSPGLEQVIMRSVSIAHAKGYRPDGDLVKKLQTEGSTSVFEIRAWFDGSNNVRILFGRDQNGRALYGYGGRKSHENWYDAAIPQAIDWIAG